MMELRPMVIDKTRVIIGGNMRYKALQELGFTEVPEEWVKRASELNEEERRRFIISDNNQFGENDWDELANSWDLTELQEWGLEIPGFAIEQPETVEDDFTITDEVITDIIPGDRFEIGEHKLFCGSSIDSDNVARLLAGKDPYVMVTDPPYGVIYNADWRNHTGMARAERAIGKVQNDDNADWAAAWNLSPSKVAYVWHAGKYASIVSDSLESADFIIRSQIIWAKNNIVISRGDYHWKHEPCWYAVKKNNKSQWAGDRKQTTVWDIAKPMKSETGHSTQKPVECMARAIRNHNGEVYDPFIGSGTTMVAAHQLKRICYGMEIDPKYCQIVINKMKALDPNLLIKKNGEII